MRQFSSVHGRPGIKRVVTSCSGAVGGSVAVLLVALLFGLYYPLPLRGLPLQLHPLCTHSSPPRACDCATLHRPMALIWHISTLLMSEHRICCFVHPPVHFVATWGRSPTTNANPLIIRLEQGHAGPFNERCPHDKRRNSSPTLGRTHGEDLFATSRA